MTGVLFVARKRLEGEIRRRILGNIRGMNGHRRQVQAIEPSSA